MIKTPINEFYFTSNLIVEMGNKLIFRKLLSCILVSLLKGAK